jgi:ABC-type amino acid transport substrate-binding protein
VRTALTRTLAIGAAAALAVGLAACSGSGQASTGQDGKDLKPFSFQLNQPPNGSNAPFAAAVKEGFYADEGLDVDIVPGTGSSQTAQMVAAGKAKIGFADSTSTTQLIAQGAPLVVVATIYQSNPNEVIALSGSGITSIADLKGKKVGTPVPSSQASMLPLFLKSNDLTAKDVTLVNLAPTSLVQALLQHQVDAILGSIDTYQVQLEQQGAKDLFTAMFADNGVATVPGGAEGGVRRQPAVRGRCQVRRAGRARAVGEDPGATLAGGPAAQGCRPDQVLHVRLPARRERSSDLPDRLTVCDEALRGENRCRPWATRTTTFTSGWRSAVLDARSPTPTSSASQD